MIATKIVLFGIIATIMFSLTAGFHSIYAAPITLDIHKAKDPGPGFGPEKIGTLSIDATGNKATISAKVTTTPKQDKVYEAWLVDTGGSNYKLSLGQFDKGQLQFTQNMVNPYTYSQFIITEEPQNDKDPNAAGTLAGTDLPPPFGQ